LALFYCRAGDTSIFEPIADIGAIRARYPGLKILVVSAYDDDVYVWKYPIRG